MNECLIPNSGFIYLAQASSKARGLELLSVRKNLFDDRLFGRLIYKYSNPLFIQKLDIGDNWKVTENLSPLFAFYQANKYQCPTELILSNMRLSSTEDLKEIRDFFVIKRPPRVKKLDMRGNYLTIDQRLMLESHDFDKVLIL